MNSHQYYLHFKSDLPAEGLKMLEAESFYFRQVFDTSYEFATALSRSKIVHILKSSIPESNYYLAYLKAGSEFHPADESD